jgi:hypothetical protein
MKPNDDEHHVAETEELAMKPEGEMAPSEGEVIARAIAHWQKVRRPSLGASGR